jgi:hypothetical protein
MAGQLFADMATDLMNKESVGGRNRFLATE